MFLKCPFFSRHGHKNRRLYPSLENRRGPLGAGLPTLEEHRRLKATAAAKYLFYSGLVDEVRFGNPLANDRKIIAVGTLDENYVELETDVLDGLSAAEIKILFFPTPTGPTRAFILGKQTACKNAVFLNRV